MRILVKKFGNILISRSSGKEAYLAFQPTLENLNNNETLIINFNGVITLTPSWADEFLTPLIQKYQKRMKLVNVSNPSVTETLKVLDLTPWIKVDPI